MSKVSEPEKYEIHVASAGVDKDTVLVTIDGETHETDGFEFAAPLGTGFVVKRLTRIELVPAPPARREW